VRRRHLGGAHLATVALGADDDLLRAHHELLAERGNARLEAADFTLALISLGEGTPQERRRLSADRAAVVLRRFPQPRIEVVGEVARVQGCHLLAER